MIDQDTVVRAVEWVVIGLISGAGSVAVDRKRAGNSVDKNAGRSSHHEKDVARIDALLDAGSDRMSRIETNQSERFHTLRNEWNENRLRDAVALAEMRGELKSNTSEIRRVELTLEAGLKEIKAQLIRVLEGQGQRRTDRGDE